MRIFDFTSLFEGTSLDYSSSSLPIEYAGACGLDVEEASIRNTCVHERLKKSGIKNLPSEMKLDRANAASSYPGCAPHAANVVRARAASEATSLAAEAQPVLGVCRRAASSSAFGS